MDPESQHLLQSLRRRVAALEDRDRGNQNEASGPETGAPRQAMAAMCSRQDARSALQARIARLHSDAANLQALLDQLPAKLSPEADAALWAVLNRAPG